MKLGISSAAAPDLGADDLIAASAARGLQMLELREGDAHDASSSTTAAARVQSLAAVAGVEIAGLMASSTRFSVAGADALADVSRTLNAPIVTGDGDLVDRIVMSHNITFAGGIALPLLGGADCVRDALVLAEAGLPYAWQADPAAADIDRIFSTLPDNAAGLRYIRFTGGGPESVMHDGRNVGSFMARLALSGYRGAFVVTPSSPEYRIIWRSWLGRRGGWGCGSKLPIAGVGS
jgi:hypothetical protein